jgi:DNA-binding CsgD family transcriptional regulator
VRERAIARALAETVERAGARRVGDALRVASWRLIGGGGRPEVLLAGAVAARWHYDFPLAERLARAAVDAGAGFDAALLAAQLASLQGRTEVAEKELKALVIQATDDAQRGALAVARIHNSVLWTGQDPLGLIDEAEGTITDPTWRDRLAAERLALLVYTHHPRDIAEAALPLLQRADGEALVQASILAVYSLARTGHIEAALDAAARGHAVHTTATTPPAWYPWWHHYTRCLALSYAGRLDDAAALAHEQYQQAVAEGSREAKAVFGALPAHDVGERGRVRTAARLARQSVAINQELGRPLLVRFGLTYGALALALGGRAQEAAEALAASDALPLPEATHHSLNVLQARAWTAVARGDLAGAHGCLEQAVAVGRETGDLVGVATALHGLARLGRAVEVVDALTEVAARIEGDLAAARAAHARALARDDPAALEIVFHQFAAMGADLLAAEAAADAAVAWQRAGRPRHARANQHRASVLVHRCEQPFTPSLHTVEARARLTPAEHQTALLAASGRSNKQIADVLCLSVRTVENRLHHVYEKLGIPGRSELGTALGLEDL